MVSGRWSVVNEEAEPAFIGVGNVWNGGTPGSVGSRLLTVWQQKVNLLWVIAAAFFDTRLWTTSFRI